ncbi:MAG TPA: YtxH domain-containing protein [Polyangia bacterium]|nr:YtxH domain-containing protein [Polyangia bacterium]
MNVKKEDILEALGIESKGSWLPIALAGFGVGAAVGAAVAMLLAPKSGRELRSDIMERGRDLIGRGKETIGRMTEEKNPMPPTY